MEENKEMEQEVKTETVEATEGTKKKFTKKKIIGLAATGVALLAAGAAAIFKHVKSGDSASVDGDTSSDELEEAIEAEE